MKTLKWGLIGAGDIVRKRVAPALRDSPMCEFVAVSRARAELAKSFAAEYGVSKTYGDWRELVQDSDLDAVYVATPVHLHAAQTVAAAEAGKHILCEKPMALDVGECDRMIAACTASGVRLGIAYYRHFYPVVRRMRDLIASGEIGDPVYAQINAFEWFDLPPDDPRGWFLKRDQAGGGPMFDFGCHRLEVLTHLFGPVRRVTGMVANVIFDRDVEDTAAALLQFERGVCAMVAVTHAAVDARDTVEIFGTRGSLSVANLNKGTLTITKGDQAQVESHAPAANFHLPLIEDFVDAVIGGREPAVNGDIGRTVAQIEQAIYADIGQAVS
jgi:predicted dehydrogenase